MKNKLLFIIMALLLVPFVSAFQIGDCDGDKIISSMDKSMLNLYLYNKLTTCYYYENETKYEISPILVFDFDGDGMVGSIDKSILNLILNGRTVYDTVEVSLCMPDNLLWMKKVDIMNIMPNITFSVICNYISNWTLISQGECMPTNLMNVIYNDTNYSSSEYSSVVYNPINDTYENCVYVLVWTFINETECYSNGTKIMAYNDTSGLYGLNYTIENCTYNYPGNGNGGSNGGSSNECDYEGQINPYGRKHCRCEDNKEVCWYASDSDYNLDKTPIQPEEKAEITIEPLPQPKQELVQEPEKEPSNAWVWWLLLIVVIIIAAVIFYLKVIRDEPNN